MAKLRFFASVKEKMGMDIMEIPVEGAISVRDILRQAVKQAGVDPVILINNSLLFAINQETVNLDQKVADGDEVAVLPPLSGGV